MGVRIKVCGVTTPADAAAAAELGADAVGLNFHPPSPRCIAEETAQAILRVLPPFVQVFAVFVDRPLAEVAALLAGLPGVGIVQMHGSRREIPGPAGPRLVPAFQVRGAEDLDAVDAYLAACRAAGGAVAGVLLDGHAPGLAGGTGRCAPWELLAARRPAAPLLLAGGLTPENVAEAVRIVRPDAVDVASGVESAPGRKDHEKMRRFIEAARGA
jgi:phosphoribosylanthranilate isomerase